jgi:hypothetical protein
LCHFNDGSVFTRSRCHLKKLLSCLCASEPLRRQRSGGSWFEASPGK